MEIQRQKTIAGEIKAKACTHKKAYNSEIEALSWGRFANERYNNNVEYSAYACKYCGKWHLTSVKNFCAGDGIKSNMWRK